MMKKNGIGIVMILLSYFLAFNTAYARAAVPLVDPAASEWGCQLSNDQVKLGLESALIARGWSPSNQKAGYMQAKTIVRGKHTLVVDINYTGASFDVNYKSSDNLKHIIDSEGVEKIHPNANSWMENIRSDATKVLVNMCK